MLGAHFTKNQSEKQSENVAFITLKTFYLMTCAALRLLPVKHVSNNVGAHLQRFGSGFLRIVMYIGTFPSIA